MIQQITFDDADEPTDLLKCHPDRYPPSDRQVPPVKMTGTPRQDDSQSLTDPPREPVEILLDGRSPSTSGSRGSSAGGSAASGKTKPPFSREQRAQYDAFVKALPAPLAVLVPRGLPDALVRAVLAAVDLGNPEEGRTVEQLVEYRLMPKWDRYYSSRDQAGPLEKPVGVLVAMLRRDAECGDSRCDERVNVDTGEACRSCEMRAVDRRADRDKERQASGTAVAPAGVPGPRVVVPRAAAASPVKVAPVVVDASLAPLGDYRSGAQRARAGMVDKAHRPR
jgi:hypothetical protein